MLKNLTFKCFIAPLGIGLLDITAVRSAKISPKINFLIILPYFLFFFKNFPKIPHQKKIQKLEKTQKSENFKKKIP